MDVGPWSSALKLFIRRLELRSNLSAEERDELLALPTSPRRVDAHRDFVRSGEQVGYAHLLAEGFVGRFAQLADGSRQMLAVHLPGDLVDLQALMLPSVPSSLQALTGTTLLKIPHDALRELAFRRRGIGAALWRDCVADAQLIAQWLVNVGRKNAQARVAHLFCELAVRLERIGRSRGGVLPLPLTQEQIAEAVGLTPVHVNRSIRALREERLISIARKELTILSWSRLVAIAEFDPAHLQIPAFAGEIRQARSA